MPHTVSQVENLKHGIRRIECRNTKLFGDRVFLVQEFPEQKHDADSIEKEIINLVEQHEIYQLLPHYRVLTSKFVVVQNHALNKCFMIKLMGTTTMDGIVDSVDDSYFARTDYKINGDVFPHTVSTVNGVVKRIECRNNKLFGDRIIWVQEFDESQDAKEHKMVLEVDSSMPHKFHPDKLLDGSKHTWYQSTLGMRVWGKANGPENWIIFKLKERGLWLPTKVMLRNGEIPFGAKKIVISMSVDGVKYKECCCCDNVKPGRKEEHWFQLSERYANHGYIKLEIQENYNGAYDKMYEFAVFGYYVTI